MEAVQRKPTQTRVAAYPTIWLLVNTDDDDTPFSRVEDGTLVISLSDGMVITNEPNLADASAYDDRHACDEHGVLHMIGVMWHPSTRSIAATPVICVR